jgi:choline dehydrogenase
LLSKPESREIAPKPRILRIIIHSILRNASEIPEITTPARAFELRGSEHDWGYKTTMIDRPEYTRVEKPNTRGKVLGGSSSLNYYTWVRGSAATFDDWVEYGGSSWDWKSCKPYFDKPATYHDNEKLYSSSLSHIGTSGPLDVAHADPVPELKGFRDALTQAWSSKGELLNEDIYGGEMHGLVHSVNTVYKGKRSTSGVFIEGKTNVTLMSSTRSKKLLIEKNKVVGIIVQGSDEREYTFRAKYEVIVSQGVYETPKLLMLSGIGPEKELATHGIKPVVKSANIGQNLLDHPIFSHVFKLKDGYGLDGHLLRAGPMHDGAVSAYRWKKGGPYSSPLLELVGFPRIDKYLETSKEYVEYKKKNGNVDPFGPGGQPHFEIDFVVSNGHTTSPLSEIF